MWTKRLLGLLLLPMLSGCASSGGPSLLANGHFEGRTITLEGVSRGYQVFVPTTQADKAKLPVVLFLHGSGERGSDNQAQLNAGLGPYLRKHLADFPAIVVLPQAPAEQEWKGLNNRIALAALDAATAEFNGDSKRQYLTGLSMGGYGTYEIALAEPQRFAAIAPICGGLIHPARPSMNVTGLFANAADPYAQVAQRLKHLPIWIFHGAKDDVVPPEYSRRMAAALKVSRAKDARYTEFPDANHNSWDAAYDSAEFWHWLWTQHRD